MGQVCVTIDGSLGKFMVGVYETEVLRETEIVIYFLFIQNKSLCMPGAVPGPGVTLLSQADMVLVLVELTDN